MNSTSCTCAKLCQSCVFGTCTSSCTFPNLLREVQVQAQLRIIDLKNKYYLNLHKAI